MIEKISTKLLDFVGSNMTIDSELAEIYKYGIEISMATPHKVHKLEIKHD